MSQAQEHTGVELTPESALALLTSGLSPNMLSVVRPQLDVVSAYRVLADMGDRANVRTVSQERLAAYQQAEEYRASLKRQVKHLDGILGKAEKQLVGALRRGHRSEEGLLRASIIDKVGSISPKWKTIALGLAKKLGFQADEFEAEERSKITPKVTPRLQITN